MSKSPDFFTDADELLKKIAWVNDAITFNVSQEEHHVEKLNNLKRYETYQFTISQFRSLLAIRLTRAYEDGKDSVQSEIKKALDIREN